MPEPATNPHWTPDLLRIVEQASSDAGFDVSSVALAADSPADQARFEEWIEAGHAGEMDWLKRRNPEGTLLRSSVRVAIPWARSILVCAMNYNADAPLSIDPADSTLGWIARYALTGRRQEHEVVPSDYHDDLLARLRRIEAVLQQHTPCETRAYVDTGPIVERAAAAKAGVGWVGKNTCILREDLGSWLLLGVIVTSLDVPLDAPPPLETPDRCGSCTRCLDACPTGALIAPRQMDASLCIAYLTIEKKGEIPVPLRGLMGRQIFGCDICQDVCPWNHRAPIASMLDLAVHAELVNPPLSILAELDAPAFRRLFRNSPIERTGLKRLRRNVAIAMGNSGNPVFLPQLELWAHADDPVLAETAQWAAARLLPTA